MSKNKTKMMVPAILILAVICASAGAYMWWKNQETTMPTIPMPQAQTPKSSAAAQNKADIAAKDLAQASITIPVAGNLGRTSELQATLEVLKLETQIEELLAKKKQLNAPPVQTAMPRLMDLPPIAPVQQQQARPLPLPEMPVARELRKNGLVSVQGVDGGELTATMRDSSGKAVTLKQGVRFGNSVITEISRQGVTLKSGNKLSQIKFD